MQDIMAGLPLREEDGEPLVYDKAVCELAARELARIRKIDEWLDAHGMFQRGGKVRPVVEIRLKIARFLLTCFDRLGMTPTGRAELGLAIAQTADISQHIVKLPHSEERARAIAAAVGLQVMEAQERAQALEWLDDPLKPRVTSIEPAPEQEIDRSAQADAIIAHSKVAQRERRQGR
jgi:hypothetical protein